MAELADAQDLGSCADRRAGSIPVTRTRILCRKKSIACNRLLLFYVVK